MLNKDKSLIKFEIEAYNQKVEKTISSFSVHLILKEKEDIISNQKIIQNLKDSTVLVIKYNKSNNYFIISFKNTIFVILQSILQEFQTFLSINKDLTIYFLKDTKDIFNSIIILKNEKYEIDNQFNEEINSFNASINNLNEEVKNCHSFSQQTCQSILSCITGYLIQEGYTKSKLRLDLFNQILTSIKELKTQKNIIENCTEKDYIELRDLGYGSSSVVKLVYHLDKCELFALKKTNGYQNDAESSYLFNKEFNNYILMQLYPCLPKNYGKTKDNNYLIFDFFEGQILSDIEFSDKLGDKLLKLNFEENILIIFQLICIIKHLNDQKFEYRDLKPNNVIINHNKLPFLVDFDRMENISNIYKEKCKYNAGFGSNFMAPELTEGKNPYSYKSDIYSIGQMIYYIMNEKIPQCESDKTPFFEQNPKLYEIYKQCIDENPYKRPSTSCLLTEISKLYFHSMFSYLMQNESILKNIDLIMNHCQKEKKLVTQNFLNI